MKSYGFISIACVMLSAFSSVVSDEISQEIDKAELIKKYEELISKRDKKDFLLSNIENLSNEHFEDSTDSYLEGYIQALLDVHYYEFAIVVYVKDREVVLYNLPDNALFRNSIVTFVENLPEVTSVKEGKQMTDKQAEEKEHHIVRKQVKGIWFPQSTVLYQPMIADPREPLYSATFRLGDRIMGKYVIAVSFGDTFPIFRWRNVFGGGDLEIDIQAGVWSDFKMGAYNNPNHEISELVTTDYLVGIPLSYAIDRWSFRLRIYHISSHLGDEFLVNHPGYDRKNPSMEAIDFFSSYQITDGIRIYFGPGWVFHSDDTYHLAPFYFEWGGEFRMFGHSDYYHRIYGTPFLAIFMRNWQACHFQFDGNALLGYEWSKLQGVGRKVRVYIQAFKGYSEGQFFKERTAYMGVGFSYGF
jgi:hypothetical protein